MIKRDVSKIINKVDNEIYEIKLLKTPAKGPPIQSYMMKQNKNLTAEAFLKKNLRSTFSHVYRPNTTVPTSVMTTPHQERAV